MFKKNTSGFVHFILLDKDTGLAITTGNVSATVFQDGAVFSSSTLTPGSNYISVSGVWKYNFSAGEMDADSIALGLTHADSVPELITINTFEHNMAEVYHGITSLVEGVTIGHAGATPITDISDFYTSTTGLSTFNNAVDFVTLAIGTVGANILEVQGAGATIGDFHAQNITAAFAGTIDANIISVGGAAITDITDFYTSTTGLSTFDYTVDFVTVANGGISSATLDATAITAIVNGVFNNVVDGSITFDNVSEMLLAWMAGKVTVVDNGTTRTISFFKRDGSTQSFGITVGETDSTEGERTTTGTII